MIHSGTCLNSTLRAAIMIWRLCFISFCFQLAQYGCTAEEYYVTAFPNGAPCPVDATLCFELSVFLTQGDSLKNSNTIFTFLEGIHQLPDEAVVIEDVVNVTFQGDGNIVTGYDESVTQSTSELRCSDGIGGIVFAQTENIRIINLTVKNCHTQSHYYKLQFVDSSLAIYSSLNVSLTHVSVLKGLHYGLVLANVLNINISHSVFAENAINGVASNVLAYYQDVDSFFAEDGYVNICETNISSSSNIGLLFQPTQQNFSIELKLQSSNFLKNKMANIYVRPLRSCRYVLEMDKVESTYSEYGFEFIITGEICIFKTIPVITITNSLFAYNSLVGFIVQWITNDAGELSISSSTFTENLGNSFVVQQVLQTSVQSDTILNLRLKDLIFEKNQYNDSYLVHYVVALVTLNSVFLNNCTFKDNIGSALYIYGTPVHFIGNNTFINNTAANGGGIHITNTAFVLLNSQSKLIFIDNHADINGGAIYIRQILTEIQQQVRDKGVSAYCFYQLTEPLTENTTKVFFFQNNTAGIAGSAVYGGITDYSVSISAQSKVKNDYFNSISSFINQPGDTVISSNPRGVCFCRDDKKNCSIRSISYKSFPGNNITFSVVIVGNRNGSTPGLIEIRSSNSLESSFSKSLNQACTDIPYSIRVQNSSTTSETIKIIAADIEQDLSPNTLFINVSIGQCPQGYQVSDGICECNKQVSTLAECFPSLQLVERSNSVWVSYSSQLNCTLASSNCPFDYCNFDPINVSLTNPNSQCALNRGYQLCGRCISDNYSLVLGSNACKYCNNNAALLIVIPIGIAGIALIGLILLLNLTVAVGTINGLIFFANIVKIYEPLFSIKPIPFLSQFISWLNLDLGIETCFYNGMNALVKIGLQFAFPFYLWFIITGIIVISKYSPKFAKLTGNNTIPVLATVILLSYTKLL